MHRALPEQGSFSSQPLSDVTPEMDIANEEVFGPIMLLMRVQDDEYLRCEQCLIYLGSLFSPKTISVLAT